MGFSAATTGLQADLELYPGIWGVALPEEQAVHLREAVQFYLEDEADLNGPGVADPLIWLKTMQAIGLWDSCEQVLDLLWGSRPVVRETIAALIEVRGSTWKHVQLAEQGVLQLRTGVLASERAVWSVQLGAMTKHLPELYELSEARVMPVLREVLIPLVRCKRSAGSLFLSAPKRRTSTLRWLKSLRNSLCQERAETRMEIHVFAAV